jgi:hypothetical protein
MTDVQMSKERFVQRIRDLGFTYLGPEGVEDFEPRTDDDAATPRR